MELASQSLPLTDPADPLSVAPLFSYSYELLLPEPAQKTPVSPLECAFTPNRPASPLESAFTKNTGGGGLPPFGLFAPSPKGRAILALDFPSMAKLIAGVLKS